MALCYITASEAFCVGSVALAAQLSLRSFFLAKG